MTTNKPELKAKPEEIIAPMEPTREMLLRGFDALDCTFDTFENKLENIAKIYKFMTEDCTDLVTRPSPIIPEDAYPKPIEEKTVPEEFDRIIAEDELQEAVEAMIRIGRNCPSYGAFEAGYQSETDFKTVRVFLDSIKGQSK